MNDVEQLKYRTEAFLIASSYIQNACHQSGERMPKIEDIIVEAEKVSNYIFNNNK